MAPRPKSEQLCSKSHTQEAISIPHKQASKSSKSTSTSPSPSKVVKKKQVQNPLTCCGEVFSHFNKISSHKAFHFRLENKHSRSYTAEEFKMKWQLFVSRDELKKKNADFAKKFENLSPDALAKLADEQGELFALSRTSVSPGVEMTAVEGEDFVVDLEKISAV